MPSEPDEMVNVLRSVWQAADTSELDEACGPQKSCRNMRQVSFDGLAQPGTDLQVAWRDRLRREGKLDESAASLRDLVLGPDQSH
jgi:hypothetical protein